MTTNWFYLVIIYILANSASKIIQKYTIADEEVDPKAYSAYWHLVVGIIALPAVFVGKFNYPDSLETWVIPLLSGLCFAAGMLLYFQALKNTEVSQVETISTTRAIWVMLLGTVFFTETLSWSKFIGVTLIFIGLLIIYWNKSENNSFGKYHAFLFLYAFLNSTAYALDKFALDYFSVGIYNVLLYILPAVYTLIIFPGTLSKMKPLIKPRKNNYFILLSGLVQAVSTLALYAAYKVGELSVVGPLSQTSTIITIIIGITFLKERWNLRRKVAGVTFALFGVMFLKFFNF